MLWLSAGAVLWYSIYNNMSPCHILVQSASIINTINPFNPTDYPLNPPSHKTKMHFPTTTALLALVAAAALPYTLAASCTGYLTTPSNIAACADQLTARGSELCKVTSGFTTTFCEIGDAMIVGVGVGSPSGVETSSPWLVARWY